MALHSIRKLCLVILPFLLITAIIFHFLIDAAHLSNSGWAEYFYIISLTANIGYFTNFIAIKMLFKPYHATTFGRQGLIPKNQAKLAGALSATLNEHFLTSEHWQEYLQQADIVSKLLSSSQNYCEAWVEQPQNVGKLIKSLSDYLQQNETRLHPIFAQLQGQIVDKIANEMSIDSLLSQGFAWVEKQFVERPQEMEFMIEPVIKTLAENIPEIAGRLVSTVDQHIENQATIKRSIAKAARWSADISEDDVKQYLFRMVASPEFRKTLFEGLQSLVVEYKNRSIQPLASDQLFDFKTIIENFINNKTSSMSISRLIGEALQKSENSDGLAIYVKASVKPVFVWLRRQLTQAEVEQSINQQIIVLIEAIDLREIIQEKARNFSPKQMENIFQSMISDQLVFIELLGAVLGALSGLALIDLTLFAGLSGSLLTLYFLDHCLTLRRDRKRPSEKTNISVF